MILNGLFMSSNKTNSCIFPGTEIELIDLLIPGSSLEQLLNICVVFCIFQLFNVFPTPKMLGKCE